MIRHLSVFTFTIRLVNLLGSTRGIHRSMTLADGMRKISQEGGVLVLLGKEEHIESQVRRFAAEDRGERPAGADWQGSSRTIGVGSQNSSINGRTQNASA